MCELENGNFVLSVENIASSGRGNHSMLLSKDSMFALFSIMTLFTAKRGFAFVLIFRMFGVWKLTKLTYIKRNYSMR